MNNILEFKVDKDIEKEMIRLLENKAQGLLLIANYKGQNVIIVNENIKDKIEIQEVIEKVLNPPTEKRHLIVKAKI